MKCKKCECTDIRYSHTTRNKKVYYCRNCGKKIFVRISNKEQEEINKYIH